MTVNQEDSKKKQKQLEQVRESHELQLKTLNEKHAEKVESIHQKLRDREKEMNDQLKQKELFLREHRQFIKVCTSLVAIFDTCYPAGVVVVTQELAAKVEECARQKRPEPSNEDTVMSAVSSRVREIARSTLHLSDLEIDDLFSDDCDHQQVYIGN